MDKGPALGMKIIYYALWPIMVFVSLFGGMIVGLIGITIGHFQDLRQELRRYQVEKKKDALIGGFLLMTYLSIVLYPLVVLRYVFAAPGRVYAYLEKRLINWAGIPPKRRK